MLSCFEIIPHCFSACCCNSSSEKTKTCKCHTVNTMAATAVFKISARRRTVTNKLSFFIIYKFWQNCTSIWQVSDLILKTADVRVKVQLRLMTKFNLTHWGGDKMANISQTTFSSVFFSMKMFEFRLKFDWSLFSRVQLTIFHHWFR